MTATLQPTVSPRSIPALAAAGTLAAAVVTVAVGAALGHAGFNVWAGLLVGMVLFAGSIPLLLWATRLAGEPQIAPLLITALGAKFVMALVRYYVSFEVYRTSDSMAYHDAGARLAPLFREGVFSTSVLTRGGSPGTRFIEIVTGTVYTFTGPTTLGGFLVFTWLGFWGLYFSYRAFRIAVPTGAAQRYLLLLFFLPTALYWSSSIGKDAWLTLAIGLGAYGSARLLTGRMWGLVPLAVGLAAASAVRAHIAVLIGAALLVAFVVAKASGPGGSRMGKRVFVVLLLLACSSVVFSNVREQLGTSSLAPAAIEQELDVRSLNSAEGGSSFSPVRVDTPFDFPLAAFTVLFRPMPYEAHNITSLAAALEGAFLFGLMILSWRRLLNIPFLIRTIPYIAFALTFIVGFVIGFSIIGNFGILARERVQVLPFVLVLLALPPRLAPPTPRRSTWVRLGEPGAVSTAP